MEMESSVGTRLTLWALHDCAPDDLCVLEKTFFSLRDLGFSLCKRGMRISPDFVVIDCKGHGDLCCIWEEVGI